MKTFAFRMLLVSALAAVGLSCSDDNSDQDSGFELPGEAPRVKLLDVNVDRNTINITIAPEDAVECAYLLVANDTGTPSDEEILTSGVSVDASAASEVVLADLKYETPYAIAAAVKNEAGITASTSLVLITSKDPYASAGDPANTYIVPNPGGYSFQTKRVSGTPIEGIAKVDWIWATKVSENDTQQRLISDIAYADGKVTFNASGERGNAVLAAFNADGTVIWTWLIWCTDRPQTMVFSSGSRFQDRILGATGATKEDGRKAWGTILYQWGRCVPIFGGYEDEYDSNGETFNKARKWTVMNPAYVFEWKAVSESTTIEGSFAAPTTFFAARGTGLNGSIYSWLDHEDRTLWREEEKSDYDPCPAGYRLPEPDDWGDWNEKLVPASDLSGGTYTYNGNTAWFPVSGCGRAYDTGECVRGLKSQFMLWNGRVTMRNDIAPGRPEFDEYFPSRVIKGLEGSISNVDAMGNYSFAHATRCVEIK